MSQLAARTTNATSARVGGLRRGVSRSTVQPIRAFFGKSDANAERKKEEQWQAQQELLAERRAKRERIMKDFNRKAAQDLPEERAAAPPRSKRAARQVVEEEEEEVQEVTPASNPLSGLLGGLFGKK